MLNLAVAAHLFILIHLAVIIDIKVHIQVIALFLFQIISLFIHVYLLRYIRLFSFLLSYGKTRATKNMQLVTQQRKRESENHL